MTARLEEEPRYLRESALAFWVADGLGFCGGWPRRWLLASCLLVSPVMAQQEIADRQGPALSFDQATDVLLRRSDAVRGDAMALQAAQDQVRAVRGLMLPSVSLDVLALRYQKTYDVSQRDLQQAGGELANQLFGGLPGLGPGGPSGLIDSVTGALQQQLPGVFSALPNHVRLQFQQNLVSPNLTVMQPIYMGGAIRSTQGAAAAAAAMAGARGEAGIEQQRLQLASAYFGQALAEQAEAVARRDLDGYEHHLSDARKLEAQGVISHLRTMEMTVARDAAARQLLRASGELQSARDVLALLLRQPGAVQLRTPLFVNRRGAGPSQAFLDATDQGQPQMREADAGVDLARQGIRMARSAFLPKVYAFGSYNMNRDHAVPTQPDWVVGVGLHYSLVSPVDRRASLSAARAREGQAQARRDQLRQDLRTSVLRAYDMLDTARLEYLSLVSSQAAADENLRVHAVAFREGEDTAAELIEARNRLSQVQLQRATAAYQYDLTLAGLLLASGQSGHFNDYLRRADKEDVQ